MAVFTIPSEPNFNVTAVTKIEESNYILASFVNEYYQIFLDNDQYLFNQLRSAQSTSSTSQQELADKMDALETKEQTDISDAKAELQEQMDTLSTNLSDRMSTLDSNLTTRMDNFEKETDAKIAAIHVEETTDDEITTALGYFKA